MYNTGKKKRSLKMIQAESHVAVKNTHGLLEKIKQ